MVSIGSLVERKEFDKDKDPERDRKYKVIRRDKLNYGVYDKSIKLVMYLYIKV